MSELMPVILPKAVFEKYVNYFDILVGRSKQSDISDFGDLEEPYCIGSNVCRFFGFSTYPGGQITSFETTQQHFDGIRKQYEVLIDNSNTKTCQFATVQNPQHVYHLINIEENSISLVAVVPIATSPKFIFHVS